MLEKMLQRAKDRAASMLAQTKETREQLEYAKKRGMQTLAGNLQEQLKRQEALLRNAETVVVEIEKDLGQLPLKGK